MKKLALFLVTIINCTNTMQSPKRSGNTKPSTSFQQTARTAYQSFPAAPYVEPTIPDVNEISPAIKTLKWGFIHELVITGDVVANATEKPQSIQITNSPRTNKSTVSCSFPCVYCSTKLKTFEELLAHFNQEHRKN